MSRKQRMPRKQRMSWGAFGGLLLWGLYAWLGGGFGLVQAAAPQWQRGIALGLFAEDPEFSYEPLLREIAATGADHVSLVVPFYQHNIGSTRIARHPRFSPPAAVVQRTLAQARRQGLQVFLFPILRLEYPVTPLEWRGTLSPRDPQAWWESYSAMILQMAHLAAEHRAAAFCVGSELSSLDMDPTPWKPLIQQVRQIYSGQLVYSANWDHYDQVQIWPLVDVAGISAYFQLTDGQRRPTLRRLVHAWREQRVQISRFRALVQKPLVFTEVGYHSQDGTNAFPWNESAHEPVDLQEQADCLRAFFKVFADASYVRGVYVWNWFGWGGAQSREYCPRGKPAAQVICQAYGAKVKTCPAAWGMPWRSQERTPLPDQDQR